MMHDQPVCRFFPKKMAQIEGIIVRQALLLVVLFLWLDWIGSSSHMCVVPVCLLPKVAAPC